MTAGHSPITRSLSAPTTTSCSSAEKRSFPVVDLTSNILPRALNPLDPKREHTQSEETSKRSDWSQLLTSVFEHLKCTQGSCRTCWLKQRKYSTYISGHRTTWSFIWSCVAGHLNQIFNLLLALSCPPDRCSTIYSQSNCCLLIY